MDVLNITILCKVVDNFGDIGFVYRLSRAILDYFNEDSFYKKNIDSLKLRLVTDNLHSFKLLCPSINENKDVQSINNVQIFNWNANEVCLNEFIKNPPEIILECFQCGRPEWLENLLFTIKVPNIVHIIMIDYLSAEPYAETFHKLQSLTRSSRVQKVNFMPGFTKKTGGLVLDKPFLQSLKKSAQNNLNNENVFNAVFFGYKKNYLPVICALNNFNNLLFKDGKKLNILLAKGVGFESFLNAYKSKLIEEKDCFSVTELNFLPQIEWDALLCTTPLLFIRGEDSLSRACLCGVPFVWHAYPQSEEYQLVKVNALLDVMKPYFSAEDFSIVQLCWQVYNTTSTEENNTDSLLQQSLTDFLKNYKNLAVGFKNFSETLLKNGDLCSNLMDFIIEIKNKN